MVTLDSRLGEVVGGRTATQLEKAFGMRTVQDLLAHYPRRMAERGELTELSSLRIDEDVTVVAEVRSSRVIRSGGSYKKVRLEAVVGDGRATLQVVFFGPKAAWREKELQPGVRGLFSGKVGDFRGQRQLVHPEYLLLRGDALDGLDADMYANSLIPVYPATQQVRIWVIANAVKQALLVLDEAPDPLDAELRASRGLLSAGAALRALHERESHEQWSAARRRPAWDEALGVQLALAQRRWLAGAIPAVPREARPGGLLEAFDASLPFTLTAGQLEIGEVIAEELGRPHPM